MTAILEKNIDMANACVEHEDFYDALEEMASESDSASDNSDQGRASEPDHVGNNELNGLHYAFWSRNPGSIDERRDEFLRKTGFVLDRCLTAREGPDDTSCVNPTRERDDRTTDSSEHNQGKELSVVQNDEGDQNLSLRIQCLDDGREFDVGELDIEGLTKQLREADVNNASVNNEEFKSAFGSSNIVQQLMKTDSEEENSILCKRPPPCKEGWLKRFSFRAANMFNKDKDSSKEVFEKCKSLGSRSQRVRVHSHKKWSKELSSLYRKQEFSAHKGSILAMKFSLDGRYLATGGDDGTLNVWKVIEDERLPDIDLLNFSAVSASLNFSVNGIPNLACFLKFKDDGKVMKKLKKSSHSDGIMIPHKVFQILEKPLQEFHGHEGEILDISWSKNGYLLSSSVDKTARLWEVGCSQCLRVFPHHDFVTCAQFNPMNDRYFISGSIDGIARIWDIKRCQVVDWIDIKEIVTAICYRPDGKGGIVGSMAGNCSFFEITDDSLRRVSVIYLQDKKTLTCKRITGFQFSPNNPSEVVVSSADSLVRVLKGDDIICKLRGSLPLIDRGQTYASFTADGKHIISATEDSNVYVWSHLDKGRVTNGKPKNIWSSESFLSHNALIAVPWHGITSTSALPPTSATRHNQESCHSSDHCGVNHDEVTHTVGGIDYEFLKNVCEGVLSGSHMWGLVIVTAGKDGLIKTYHNYGLPVRFPSKNSIKSSLSFSNIKDRCRDNCTNLRGSTSLKQ